MITLWGILGAAALHSIWQSALIAAAAWLLLFASTSALARYRVAMSSLFLIATLFAATALLSFRSSVQPSIVALPEFNPIMQRTLFTLPQLLQWIGFAWLSGLLATLLWYAGGWIMARRIYVRGAGPARGLWQARVAAVARGRGMPVPLVLSSEVVDSPAVFGFSHP
ncbi:MAG TPA: hypothetical protein VM100_03465, partial [Longimicrobiales bacterium]|nr:hypothetical protein [Longimicrobiales bacterium]